MVKNEVKTSIDIHTEPLVLRDTILGETDGRVASAKIMKQVILFKYSDNDVISLWEIRDGQMIYEFVLHIKVSPYCDAEP